ncbi:MAG: indole-3-glycerol phosphate synthase TrpC [Anaerolineales bacterium]
MMATGNILEQIFTEKRQEVANRKHKIDLQTMRRQAEEQQRPLDFYKALKQAKPALIAEIKRASPSKGDFAVHLSASELAQCYLRGGAAAISVLTDEHYFRGSFADLRSIAELPQRVPILQKDFLCDCYQVYEARANGADAILLIASFLEVGLLQELHDCATQLGMSVLVEVHTADELEKALRLRGLKILGVNNRNLRDFRVDLQTCLELRPRVPPDILFVAESGIKSADDVRRLMEQEITAFLVGETLVRSKEPTQKIKELLLKDGED